MKTCLTFLLAVSLPFAVPAADQLNPELQRGLFEEEANQNFDAAIKAYQSVLTTHDSERKLAATALFRLGECYRKLGKTNDAVTQYQRLVAEFPDQATLANLSRQNLTGLGASTTVARRASAAIEPPAAADPAARTQLKELLQNEITIATRFAAEQRKGVEVGRLAKGEEVRFERDVLNLKRQFIAADGLVSAKDRQEWRELLLQEIQLAEEATRLEKQKLDNGKSVASEVARLQRDVLILKRELVAFDAAPPAAPVTAGEISAALSPEAEELARTERLLAQLQGWDLSQLRRLIPSLVPDAEMERLEKYLTANQDDLRTLEANRNAADYQGLSEALIQQRDQLKVRIADRAEQIVAQLERRAATLRERVSRQSVQSASRPSRAAVEESAAPTDEEGKEVRRIQALIKDSPDLINAVNVEVTKIRSGELMVPKNGTLLHKAANQGQLSVAKFLLDHGADVGARDEMGRTPLHRAAGNGHRAMVELLLANKADANAKVSQYPDNGSTALHLAAGKGYRTVCETLLARGADPNLGDASGTLPIYSAVWADDEATLRLLLARGAKANPEPGKKGYAPLHSAKATNIARILIGAGAVVDALTAANESPLHSSASAGNRGVVEVLLAAGANPNLRDKDGKTPLHLAAANWKASVVGPLIAKGANPNERNSYGGVPLDALIKFADGNKRDVSFAPQLETLQAFLAGGADPNLTSVGGAPHLFRAVSEGLEEQAEALLKAGADPNAKSDQDHSGGFRGQTPLIRALRGTKRVNSGSDRTRSMALVNLLLEHKADPNLANTAGDPPLYYAIGSGSQDFAEKVPFVEALLKQGANIEGRNSEGKTPLAVAVDANMKEMVELLLKHKADPNAKMGDGRTLLHLAVGKRNPELLDLLLAAGANPNALDAQGMSALDYAKPGALPPPSGGFGGVAYQALAIPGLPVQPSAQPREVSKSELAERLRKAGARDWAPRPGLITVTRRSAGVSQAIFSKGTNDWNRHSLLELIAFTYFGSGTHFPFPDFSRLMITRRDPASGAIKEFTVDLTAKLAADGCKADEWLEWGDLMEIPEGVHRLDEKWIGLPAAEAGSFEKCIARKVTLKAGATSKELELTAGNNWLFSQPNGMNRYQRDNSLRLRDVVLKSGLLLTSSDLSRTKVTRQDTADGRREWTFDLTKSIPGDQDLWLRDGDVIEVPEKDPTAPPSPKTGAAIVPGDSSFQSVPARALRSPPVPKQ